jgi:hypothetical protein
VGRAPSARKEARLRLDPDLLAWFKRQGPDYQARINAALRAFVEAHERAGARSWGPPAPLGCSRPAQATF